MISPKKLIKLAKKWQRIAALKRQRISLPRITSNTSSSVADKGHFVIYTSDQNRFVIPISYLNNHIFQDLLRMSEEEFGLPSHGPITLPFDAIFMEYAVSLIKGCVDETMEAALLMSITSSRCTLSHDSLHCDHNNTHQSILCSC